MKIKKKTTGKTKYRVTAPITVQVACEVDATSPAEALSKANNLCSELTPLFEGVGSDLGRPHLLSCNEDVWFEYFEQCEFFRGGKAEKL